MFAFIHQGVVHDCRALLLKKTMKAIHIPGSILHLAESKATCPCCTRKIPFDEIEKKWQKAGRCHIKIKCLCKRFIGVTQNIVGDFVAYEINSKS